LVQIRVQYSERTRSSSTSPQRRLSPFFLKASFLLFWVCSLKAVLPHTFGDIKTHHFTSVTHLKKPAQKSRKQPLHHLSSLVYHLF